MKLSILFYLSIILLLAQTAFGQIPKAITYQGVLTDANNTSLPDANYNMSFRLYEAETGGQAVWTESHSVELIDGVFSVVLGENSALNLPFDRPYWLGVSVNGESELTPRMAVTSSAYSLTANEVRDGAITDAKIAGGQVVKSLNGIKDDVQITAGDNISILKNNNSLIISADTTGGGGSSSGWQISNNNLISTVSGNVGIGISNPYEKLDVLGNTIFRNVDATLDGNSLNFLKFSYGDRKFRYAFAGGGYNLLTRGAADAIIVHADRINGTYAAPAALQKGDVIYSLNVSGRNAAGSHSATELLQASVFSDPVGEDMPMKYSFGHDAIQVEPDRVRVEKELHIVGGRDGNTGNYPTHFNFSEDGKNYIRGTTVIADNGGNVGIGTTDPKFKLEIYKGDLGTGQNDSSNLLSFIGLSENRDQLGFSHRRHTQGSGWVNAEFRIQKRIDVTDQHYISFRGTQDLGSLLELGYGMNPQVTLLDNGNLGIGTTSPTAKFEVQAVNADFKLLNQGESSLYFQAQSAGNTMIQYNAGAGTDGLTFNNGFGGVALKLAGNLNVGIGTSNPQTELHVEGTTTTKVLTITGGADLAEPFEMTNEALISVGSVVVIDPENPGQLTLSNKAYDTCVAGIVSGAGGVNPGLTLQQEGVLENGQNVALSGRVYAKATTTNGAIRPGDLLTTSDIPGHAMRVADHDRANGTIIGKAMTALQSGEGLVLVLVSLQ